MKKLNSLKKTTGLSQPLPENFIQKVNEREKRILQEIHTREMEESLYAFLKEAWKVMEGNKPFIHGWHIEAIAEHLEACGRRQIKNLLINVPPRSSKSSLVSVAFPAWLWIKQPHEQFMYASYAASLALKHSQECRRLITSRWYQERWGNIYKLSSDQNAKSFFENKKSGYRMCTSVGGSSTGSGGSFLIADDPNNAKDRESKAKRLSANDWHSQVWSTRLNDPQNDVNILVQQRLAIDDVSGFMMSNDDDGDIVKIIIPNEFEESRRCITIDLKGTGEKWKDPRTKEGELLCVHRCGLKETAKYKKKLGSYGYAGQFQQRPVPAAGGIIKEDWFGWWKKAQPPELIKIIQSWDTAFKEGEQNDYSVCTTWGIFSSEQLEEETDDKIRDMYDVPYNCAILLSMWRERASAPDLRKRAMRLYENFTDTGDKPKKFKESNQPDIILIEDMASGQSLIQDLYRSGIRNIVRMYPGGKGAGKGDKVARVHYVSPLIENGRVYLAAQPPKNKDDPYTQLRPASKTLLEECINFPKAEYDDIVDTLSQMLIYCKRTQLLRITHDPVSSYEEPDSEGVQFF